MNHGRTDYNRIQDPDGKIPTDEPVFLLRAQDPAAAETVRRWADYMAYQGSSRGMDTSEIVASARAHADLMDAWELKVVVADL